MTEKTLAVAPSQPEAEQEVTTESLRSRASSVISTGTRISILTLPQSDSASQRNNDSVLTDPTVAAAGAAATAPRLVPRPLSIYSFRSTGETLPPYSEIQSLTADSDGRIEEGRRTSNYLPNSESDDAHANPSGGSGGGGGGRMGEIPNAEVDSHAAQTPTTPLSDHDPENVIAKHYGTIVRTIDDNNAQLIARMKQDHAQELATMRNAIDGEYRKVLKARNQEIERHREVSATRESELEAQIEGLKARVEEARLETVREVERVRGEMDEEIDRRCVKARHMVEDLWEERWQKRNELAAEESRRSEREWRETVRLLVDEEREKWEAAVERHHGPEERDLLRKVVERRDDGDGER